MQIKRSIKRPIDTTALDVGERHIVDAHNAFLVQSENHDRKSVTLFATCSTCGVGYKVEVPRSQNVETPPYHCRACNPHQWRVRGYWEG